MIEKWCKFNNYNHESNQKTSTNELLLINHDTFKGYSCTLHPNGWLSNQYWMLASLIKKRGYVSLQGKNNFLNSAHDWIHYFIWDWHPVLDLEVGSTL